MKCGNLYCHDSEGCSSNTLWYIFIDSVSVNTTDASYDVPKPLITAISELGESAADMVDLLRQLGADNDDTYEGGLILKTSIKPVSFMYIHFQVIIYLSVTYEQFNAFILSFS